MDLIIHAAQQQDYYFDNLLGANTAFGTVLTNIKNSYCPKEYTIPRD